MIIKFLITKEKFTLQSRGHRASQDEFARPVTAFLINTQKAARWAAHAYWKTKVAQRINF
ncbi:Nitrilase/cyanide hydratase and apolipoprotein N-acyltransferase [Alicyclobacillus hesperidum URH17-3-68]|nr:Nitrilase/cyanide hydratase and apolipoprotein N-acyltransferase [Alicyclobacillus hesperidum URH17-3-68]